MPKRETRIDYGRRIARVGRYIADNLDAELDVERLAAVASLSPWHFHRIYREATGETLADTVRRLRLHRAAVELVRGDAPLEQVARRAGYGTLAAFSRAFAADYGSPPGAYRQRRRLSEPLGVVRPEPDTRYPVEMAPYPGLRLAAVAHRGDYQEIGRTFDRIFAWAGGRGLLGPSARSIGLYYDDPLSTPKGELRSHAGISIDVDLPAEAAEAGILIIEIPPLVCAGVVHKGPYAELETPYRFLYGEWLPRSGCEPDDHPCFEEYLNDPRRLPPSEWLTRIHLPLKEPAP